MENTHNFHFVFTNELSENLKKFIRHMKFSRSEGVDCILCLLKHEFQNKLKLHEENNSHYLYVGAEKDIWAEISEGNYRWVKQFHDMSNTFSMAQIVRKCLVLFFNMVDDLGSYAAAFEYFHKCSYNIKKLIKNANLRFYDRLKSHMCNKSGKIIPQVFVIDENYHLLDEKLLE